MSFNPLSCVTTNERGEEFKTYRVIVGTFCIQVKREVRKRSRGIGNANLAVCPLCFLVLVPADGLIVPSSEIHLCFSMLGVRQELVGCSLTNLVILASDGSL